MNILAALAVAISLSAAPAGLDWKEMREEQDLSAQIGMQVAAEQMVQLTRWQIVLGWITAAGLLMTLAMTQRSLTLTRESIDITRSATKAELRPYFAMTACHGFLGGKGGPKTLKFDFTNVGQTPAKNVRWRFAVQLVYGTPDRWPLDTGPHFVDAGEVAPGHVTGFMPSFDQPLPNQDIAKLNGQTAAVATLIVIEYDDAFGDSHKDVYSDLRNDVGLTANIFNKAYLSRADREAA